MAIAVLGIGWALNVSIVRSVVPGAVGMKAQTAFGLAVGAAAVLLLRAQATSRRRKLGLVLAIAPGLLGVAVLSEYVFHLRLGIDEWPFVDHSGRTANIKYPGRFAPTTGACFVLLSVALLTLDLGKRWKWRPSELLTIPMGLVAFISIIGYLYSIPAFYGPASAAKMAINTALCFIALAVATVLARPRGRVLELATTSDPGGVMLRRVIPLCVLGPLILGSLRLQAVGWGVFNNQVGTWWLAAATIAGLVALMSWCAGTLSRADEARRLLETQLAELANRDGLTGLFNGRRFGEELDQLLARARRYGNAGSLLLLDLDRLKSTNDTLGHRAGDELLRAVADAITKRVRETDVVARLGGDEFAVLLLETPPSAAVDVADDLCVAISAIRIETDDGTGWSSASIGVAPVDGTPGLNASELLNRADGAMYRAKRAGGNQVELTEYAARLLKSQSV